jgi:hypothetical protein
LSARIRVPRCLGVRLGFERGDDLVEVAEHLPVHLGQPLLVAGFGGGDDLDDLTALLVVLRQELRGGDEHRAGQAGVDQWNANRHCLTLPPLPGRGLAATDPGFRCAAAAPG